MAVSGDRSPDRNALGDQQLLHEDPNRARVPELRCHLFSLEALLRSHIEREERYLIPLLADDAWVEPLTVKGTITAG